MRNKNGTFKKGANPWNTGRATDDETKRKISKSLTGKRHSTETRKKMSLAKKGKKAYQWKNGSDERHKKIRKTLEYRLWRETIFERDDWKCQICGRRGHHLSLRANHIKRFSEYPDLRLDKNNGITICEECDIMWVLRREEDWESYFNFNLANREVVM